MPADDGAVESRAVGAGVDEAESQRVGEVELWELVGGRGGEHGRVGLKGAAKAGVGRSLDTHEHMFACVDQTSTSVQRALLPRTLLSGRPIASPLQLCTALLGFGLASLALRLAGFAAVGAELRSGLAGPA